MQITAKKYAADLGVTGATVSRWISKGNKLPGVIKIDRIGNYCMLTVSKNYNCQKNKEKFRAKSLEV